MLAYENELKQEFARKMENLKKRIEKKQNARGSFPYQKRATHANKQISAVESDDSWEDHSSCSEFQSMNE